METRKRRVKRIEMKRLKNMFFSGTQAKTCPVNDEGSIVQQTDSYG